MADEQPLRVLIVAGDHHFCETVERGLFHPRLEAHSAHDEKSIVAALTEGMSNLAIVGRSVGRRGPLVLCDAVRARQGTLPILVLVDKETDDEQLAAHKAREMLAVRYLDLRYTADGHEKIAAVRKLAIEMLGAGEDDEAAALWPELIKDLEATAAADAAPSDAPAPSESAPAPVPAPGEGVPSIPAPAPAPGSAQGEAPAADDGPPPVDRPVTEEDVEFAKKMIAHTRKIDFRAAPQTAPAPDGVDRKTQMLREKVRDLERQLARLAHVYSGRAKAYDAGEAALEEIESSAMTLRLEHEALLQQSTKERNTWASQKTELEKQVAALTQRYQQTETNLQQAREEASGAKHEVKQKEEGFVGTLTQTQEVVSVLKDQAEIATANFQQQIDSQTEQLQREKEAFERLDSEIAELRFDLERAAAEKQEVEDKALQEREAALEAKLQLEQGHTDKIRELEEKHAERMLAFGEESTRLAQERMSETERIAASRGEVAGQVTALEADLTTVRQEGDQRKARIVELEVEVQQLSDALAAKERERTDALKLQAEEHAGEIQGWSEKVEELKNAADIFRGAHQEHERAGAKMDKELAVLRQRTEAQEEELQRLRGEHKELNKSLERERSRSLESMLDARLIAVEEFARSASERSGDQHEMLTALEQRSGKQEALIDRVLAELGSAPGAGEKTGSGDEAASVSRLTAGGGAAAGWISGSLVRLGLVVGAIIFFNAVVTWIVLRPSAVPRAVATTAAADLTVDAPTEPVDAPEAAAPADVEQDPEPEESEESVADANADEETGDVADDTKAADETAAEKEPPKPQKPAPAAPVAKGPKSDKQRKELRRAMFDAAAKRKWKVAAEAGSRMRARYALDWEAQAKLADILRRTGKIDDAIEVYQEFLKRFPGNVFVDEALLRTGNLLVKLDKKAEAIPIYKRLAKKKNSKLRGKANMALKALGEPPITP